jgi:hypothetical protein
MQYWQLSLLTEKDETDVSLIGSQSETFDRATFCLLPGFLLAFFNAFLPAFVSIFLSLFDSLSFFGICDHSLLTCRGRRKKTRWTTSDMPAG